MYMYAYITSLAIKEIMNLCENVKTVVDKHLNCGCGCCIVAQSQQMLNIT